MIDPTSLITSLAYRLDELSLAYFKGPLESIPDGLDVPAVGLLLMPKTPIRAIAIHPWWQDSDPATTTSTPLHAVQLTFREPGADPRPVLDREYAVRRALHSMLPGIWPGGVTPLSVSFSSAAPADRDDDGHWTRSADFLIQLNPGGM